MTGADRKTTTHNTFIDPPSMRPYDSLAAIQSALMPPFSHQSEYKWPMGIHHFLARAHTAVAGSRSESRLSTRQGHECGTLMRGGPLI